MAQGGEWSRTDIPPTFSGEHKKGEDAEDSLLEIKKYF
jgi:hypothetical protein